MIDPKSSKDWEFRTTNACAGVPLLPPDERNWLLLATHALKDGEYFVQIVAVWGLSRFDA